MKCENFLRKKKVNTNNIYKYRLLQILFGALRVNYSSHHTDKPRRIKGKRTSENTNNAQIKSFCASVQYHQGCCCPLIHSTVANLSASGQRRS